MRKSKKFFEEKKPWSLMKDQILGSYLVPYLAKVRKFQRTIIIVDGFAGCGFYGDGTPGSPIIISERIKTLMAKGGKALGIFVENDPGCYLELEKNLKPYIEANIAITLREDFKKISPKIVGLSSKSPMFFFIDPFGIKGLEFTHLKRIFERVNIQSTEVLVNFSYKALKREAKAVPVLARAVMGGNYYEEILNNSKLSPSEKETRVLELYKDGYRKFFTYVGSCPIMYKDDQSKYYLIFSTSHFDGHKLMNDIMGKIYRNFYTEGRLFPVFPSGMGRDMNYLEEQVMEVLRTTEATSRLAIKKMLIPGLFMRYTEGDCGKTIKKLLVDERIFSETGMKRINDNVMLSIKPFKP